MPPPKPIADLSGPKPGVLDAGQPSRILRHPNASLSFAAYDPLTAIAPEAASLKNLSLSENASKPAPHKMIVVETVPEQGLFWRFVPKARLGPGVVDEGTFPRVVNLCGQLYNISESQWNIYKLDTFYDCYVPLPPDLTVISPKGEPKEHIDPVLEESIADTSQDSDRMSIDSDFTPAPPPQPSLRGKRPRLSDHHTESRKRAESEEETSFSEEFRDKQFYTTNRHKRHRTKSPTSTSFRPKAPLPQRRPVLPPRVNHVRKKHEQILKEKERRYREREEGMNKEFVGEPPESLFNDAQVPRFHDIPEEDGQTDLEEHERKVEESKRKLQELRKQESLDLEEQLRKKAREEEARLWAELQQKQEEKRRKEEEEARKLAEEAEKRAEEQRLRAEKLRKWAQERSERHQQWNSGFWSLNRSLQRFKTVSAYFDETRFSYDDCPLTFEDIPWPTVRHPRNNRPELMDWQSVKAFFDFARQSNTPSAYRQLLKNCLQRFHPDRWRSRNLYGSILKEEERDFIEVAVLSVSQALGNLWDEHKKT